MNTRPSCRPSAPGSPQSLRTRSAGALAFLLLVAVAVAPATRAATADPPEIGPVIKGVGAGRTTTFRVWAPDAHAVAIQGDFTGWKKAPMQRDPANGQYWVATSARARDGDGYQFVIDDHLVQRDPAARRVNAHENKGYVVDPTRFDWAKAMAAATPARPGLNAAPARPVVWKTPDLRDMVMYELHLGTFVADIPGGKAPFLRAIRVLPYLRALGVNAIQLMPVNEFPGDRSWGYNPGDLFAIESSYGTPDEFRTFVAACHAQGIAVLLDIVHNHYGPDQLALWSFGWNDGPGPYFYADPTLANTEWGPRPDFSKPGVREFIHASVRMFLEEYRLDGFRWDSVHNIRYTPENAGEANSDGDTLLRTVNAWMQERFPAAIRVAEDHAFDNGGVGFHAQWNSAFQADLSGFLATVDDQKDVTSFAALLSRLQSSWIQFSECHDSAGDLNGHHRIAYHIDHVNPESLRARALSLMANAIVMTVPGTPMYLQGLEAHDTRDFSDQNPFPWGAARGPRKGLVQASADLARLRRNLDGHTPGLRGEEIAILQADPGAKVIAYSRRDSSGTGAAGASTLVIHNCGPAHLTNYAVRLPAPVAGKAPAIWYCHFTSANPGYDAEFKAIGPRVGDGFHLSSATQNALALDLGPWSTVILSPAAPARPNVKVAARCTLPEIPAAGPGPVAPGALPPGQFAPGVDTYVEQIIDPFPYFFLPLP